MPASIVPAQPSQATHHRRSPSPSDVVVLGHRRRSFRPVHSFTRTTSTSSKGAPHDPIDVDDAVRRRRLVFASDIKPAHSFFTRTAESDGGRAPSVASTAAQGATDEQPRPLMHSFFQANGGVMDGGGKLREGWGKGVKEGEGWLTPWPGRQCPSHVAAAEPFAAGSKRPAKRRRIVIDDHLDQGASDYWLAIMMEATKTNGQSGSTATSAPLPSLSAICQNHPAFTSLRHKYGTGNRETWCERYRPHRADEVLGNELEATYLRDWLTALQVGGRDGESRRVIRKVKRQKRQLFDGWIVDDIGLFGDADLDDDDDEELPEESEEPELALGERPHVHPSLSSRLSNTILLTGPHGSGKSAAVYAAATELGWEVFEVYPGIGRRTGSNLMSLVGDVGKNHMVVKGGSKAEGEKIGVTKSFFAKAEKEVKLGVSSQILSTEPIKLGLRLVEADAEVLAAVDSDSKVRQSVILIDEVDILFAEENTFWPAVISLIAESKRPVILTCNGEVDSTSPSEPF